MHDNHDDLYEVVKETIDKLLGVDAPFIVIIPSNQQIATNLTPNDIPPLLATIVASMLNQNTIIREHIDEDGEEYKDTMN